MPSALMEPEYYMPALWNLYAEELSMNDIK